MCMLMTIITVSFFFFFFNDTATTEIYTLSLHDALPISVDGDVVGERAKIIIEKVVTEFGREVGLGVEEQRSEVELQGACTADRKSTRLNSSHGYISYAVFCLKKKKKPQARVSLHTSHATTIHNT